MRDSVVFYRSFYEAIKELGTPEEFRSCVEAIMEYGLNEIEPECSGTPKAIFIMAKAQIDANNKRYDNGRKGGRPVTKPQPTRNQALTNQKPNDNQTVTEPEPKEKENVKENDKVNANVKVKENIKEKENTYSSRFCELWDAYPRRKEKAKAYKCYNARLNDGYSEDELITAVKRYAKQCREQNTEERYIKLPATFLGSNTPFTDFLGDNHEKSLTDHERFMGRWDDV